MHKELVSHIYKKAKHEQFILCFTILTLLLIIAGLGVLLMTIGNTNYTLNEVIDILQSPKTTGAAYTIKKLRLPKLLIGCMAGMSFGMAGYTFQTLLKNHLASPDIIGVTSGSSVAAIFCILIMGVSGVYATLASIISGLVITCLILLLSGSKNNYENRMILIGIGMQAFLNALISWMLLKGSEYDVATALRWLRGSLNGVVMSDVLPTFILFIIGISGLVLLQKNLKLMLLGDEYALSLGVNIKMTRLLAMCCALLLTASATAVTGPIASVAFLSGPIASKLISKNHSALIASGLVGVILVYASEFIGQNAFATRYPVGVITGLLGAPYLLYLLFKMNKKGAMS